MLDLSAEKVVTGAPSLSPSADSPVATSQTDNKTAERTNLEVTHETSPPEYLTGIRLYGLTAALLTATFLSILEISIVSTALVDITDDLKSFDQSSWIVTAYLLTYTGFIIIWAKFSDTFGRRACLATALLIFMIASGACGAAQTATQLIIFRAFQGIGGSGITGLNFVIIAELVPAKKYGIYSVLTTLVYAVAYLVGPLVGGAICENTTWRWVFIINAPIGIIPLVALYAFMPANFPEWQSGHREPLTLKQIVLDIDYIGAASLFGFCIFLVAAFQEANSQYPWNSAVVIILFIFSGIFFLGFIGWQKYLSIAITSTQAILPWRMMKHRLFMCTILLTILSGVPFTVAVIQIPQRYQTVGQTSPVLAGVDLLPFTLLLSLGTIVASVASSRFRVPPLFVFLVGGIFQTVGAALMSTLGIYLGSRVFGYEILLSFGLGMNLGMGILFTPQLITGQDQSVAMGAVIQARPLGGAFGLAITIAAFNSYVKSQLSGILSSSELSNVLQSVQLIDTLPTDQQVSIRLAFSDGYNLQMQIVIGFSAAQLLVAAAMWEKKLTRVA